MGHLVDCFGAGGIATGVLSLIGFTGEQVDHTIISISDDLRLLARLPSTTPAYVIKPGPSKLIGFCARLARLARRQRIDVLHCNNQFAWLDASMTARIISRPCLQTFHGVERPVAEIARDVRWKCWLAARLGSVVTAVGEASRRMVCDLSGVPEQCVEVIPNGIDLDLFQPRPRGHRLRSELRDELAIGPDVDLVAHVAGLRPVKDQKTLLQAWCLVMEARERSHRPEPLLLMVGEGPCQDELLYLAGELRITRAVRFLGQRRDLNEILPACDLFALSSISEGLSFAILEAMACALPVVATRVGGNSELVEEGETGFLTPPRDPVALSKALISLLDNPGQRLRMGESARHVVELRHDAAKSAERYLRLYRKMVAGPPRDDHRSSEAVGFSTQDVH